MAIDANILTQQTPVASPLENFARLQQIKLQQEELKQRAQLMPGQVALQQQAIQGGQQEIDQRAQAMKALQTLDAVMKTAYKPDESGNLSLDRNVVTTGLAQAGLGHKIPEVLEGINKSDEAAAKIQKLKEENAKANAEYGGILGSQIEAAGNTPQAALFGIAQALKHGVIDQQTALQYTQQIQSNPAIVPQISAKLKAGTDQVKLDAERQTAEAHTKQANVQEAELPGRLTLQQAQAREAQQRATGQVPLTPYQQREIQLRQREQGLAAQRENREQSKFAATFGSGTNEQGQVLPAVQAQAKAIIDERAAPFTGRSAATGLGAAVMSEVYRQKPDYDANSWTRKAGATKDFGSGGASGKTAIALNTLVRHSDDMYDAIDGLNNGNLRPGNALYNAIKKTTGNAGPIKFEQLREYVAGETVKTIRGSGGSEGDIQAAKKVLDAANSPEQLKGALDTTLSVAGGKMQALNDAARSQGLGKDYTVLDPDAQKVLKRRGIDTTTMKRGAAPAANGKKKSLDDIFSGVK